MAQDIPEAAALALVPGLEAGAQPLLTARLAGGSVNDVWRVDSAVGSFVVRQDGAAWRRPGVNRQREQVLHALAAGVGLAPRIVAQSALLDVMVTPYVDADRWTAADFSDPRCIELLGETLAALHRLALPVVTAGDFDLAGFNPVQVAEDYSSTAVQLQPARAALVELLCARVAAAAQRLLLQRAGVAIVHGDPTAGNLLGRQPLWLIDWEYSQLTDPLLDVAAVLVYQPASRQHLQRLLSASQLLPVSRGGRLLAAAQIHDSLHWLWRMARGEAVDERQAGNSLQEWAN